MDRETQYRLSTRSVSIKTIRKERKISRQSNFKADLEKKMGSKITYPDDIELLWCPATGSYWDREMVTASHLFPRICGKDTMKAIFGGTDSGESEMFSAENGILWSEDAKRLFENGFFVIVPDIVDQPTKQQVETWEASDPKEYKIRVVDRKRALMQRPIQDPKHTWMQEPIQETTKTWADLDNVRLKFRTDFRPCARYLYFRYCVAVVYHSFYGHKLRCWGPPGRYMREGMLLAFVEEMGHEYEYLLEGAIKENGAVADPTALAAANSYIQRRLRSAESEYDSDFDTDDDGEDDDFFDDDGNEEVACPWGSLDDIDAHVVSLRARSVDEKCP